MFSYFIHIGLYVGVCVCASEFHTVDAADIETSVVNIDTVTQQSLFQRINFIQINISHQSL